MSTACGQLHALARRLSRFKFPFNAAQVPSSGIYLLFEKGEAGHDGDRIVRVGTHTGDGNLRQRLQEHFLHENKDRSIFRKNIGRAMLARDNDNFLAQWEWDLTSHANRGKYGSLVDVDKLRSVEARVTEYLVDNCSFAVLPVGGDVVKRARLDLEATLIATVAQCPACGPSRNWLGLFSPKPTIRRSGLWQIQHLSATPLTSPLPRGLGSGR